MTKPRKGDRLAIALRAFVERQDTTGFGTGTRFSAWRGWPKDALILDTETTIDEAQRLLFGFFRIARWGDDGRLATLYEGIVHANDLAAHDPEGFATLQAFAEHERADVANGQDERLFLLSRDDFMDAVFWPVTRRTHGLVAGFNLPFDLTRLALRAGAARRTKNGNNKFRGGFSFLLSDYEDIRTGDRRPNRYDPRLWIKHIGEKRAFMQLAAAWQLADTEAVVDRDDADRIVRRSAPPGHFLDLSTLAFALTTEKHSLRSAAEAFGTEHQKTETADLGRITTDAIAYARNDVLVTLELLEKLRAEFDRHPIQLDPCKAFSSAGIGKAYLDVMGVVPPSRAFSALPNEIKGIAMNAYYGGRAEARIRRTVVPVVHTDFLSMYSTVNTLLGLWDLITAEELVIEDATEEVRAMLAGLTLNACFDRDVWPRLRFYALVQPDEDVLPVRAQYNPNRQGLGIGVNHLSSEVPIWYAGPDIIASTLLTGKPPHVLRAVRLSPRGKQASLRPVTFASSLTIDPAREDFFQRVIELRRQAKTTLDGAERDRVYQFLKILASSTGYGVFAEMNREELAKDEVVDVAVYGRNGPFERETDAPENPGLYAFQPFASLTTAAARLMLALAERLVTDRGGAYAFCDTDSMAIVATEEGGPVPGLSGRRALSFDEVHEVVRRFEVLNPYDPTSVPGSILEIEDVCRPAGESVRSVLAYVISAKRYAFFTQPTADGVEILDASEHGLGHLMDPLGVRRNDKKRTRQWIVDAWEALVRETLGFSVSAPSYLPLPAVSRIAVTTPRMLDPFEAMNRGRSYDDQVKPSNFLLSATIDRFGHPAGIPVERYKRFHLIRSFTTDLDSLTSVPWIDLHTGEEFRITAEDSGDPFCARVKTFADVLLDYRTHIEAKSAGPDGRSCRELTAGLLARRHVIVASVKYIGKEANRLDDAQNGIIHDVGEVLNVYTDPADDPWLTDHLPRLRLVPVRWMHKAVGISERRIRMLRAGDGRPNIRTRKRIIAALSAWSRRGQRSRHR